MAKSSALKKLQTQKTSTKKSKKAAAPKTAKEAEKVENKKEEPIPTAEEIMIMKTADLDYTHTRLEEALGGWEDFDRTEKRKALVEAIHGDESEEEDESDEEEDEEDLSLLEEDDQDEETADLDEELEEEPDENVVSLKKSSKKSSKKEEQESEEAEKKSVAKKSPKKKAKPDADDVLANVQSDIENLDEEAADVEVMNLKDDIEYTYFRLGGVLANIKDNKFIGDYKSFREKVEAEFGMKYRKAEYLISAYTNITESGVDYKALKGIGWSKLSLISHLLTPDNVEEWVEKASSMKWSTLQAEVKEMRKTGTSTISKAPKSDITRMTFQVHEDQRETIEAALEKAKEEGQTDVNTVALEYICQEYLAGGMKKAVVKEPTVEQFFKQLVKSSDGDVEVALGTLLEGAEFEKVFGVDIRGIDFVREEGDD